MLGSFRRHPSRLVRALIAVALAIIGAALVWAALARPSTSDSALTGGPNGDIVPSMSPSAPEPTTTRDAAGADQDVRDQITGLVLPESEPVTVSIPKIGVRSTLAHLGLDEHGKMKLPPPARAGWFSRGAAPGALGPAVITGHVTWHRAPAVFYRLGTLQRGDQVRVTRKDGKTAVFTVTRVTQFSKSKFPSEMVYGDIDHAGLRLITCGGTWDGNKYLDNVIVFAKLKAVRGP
jgi:hypothetical protein